MLDPVFGGSKVRIGVKFVHPDSMAGETRIARGREFANRWYDGGAFVCVIGASANLTPAMST